MARRSSRGRGRSKSSGKGAAWKNSKALAGVLVVAIIVIWFKLFFGGDSSGDMPPELENFPYTYMTEESREIVIVRGKGKAVPFEDEESGEQCWEAYVCTFEGCPGRGEDGEPYKFPHVLQKMELPEDQELPPGMPPYDYMTPPVCPLCQEERIGGPEYVQRYQTEEGAKLLKKMQERLRKERKEND